MYNMYTFKTSVSEVFQDLNMLRTKFFQFFGLEKFVFSNYVIFLDSCLPAVLVIHAIMYYTKNTKKYIFLVFWELFGHCRRLNLALYC